ncbi:MAG: lactococcin G-beta/enterocin 1071B family bacteriocin [Vagococcus fluvialis]
MKNYTVLSSSELQNTAGGKIPGWLGLLEPGWDFIKGIGKGFSNAMDKDK